MSSSSDDDELESVAPIELSEYETDFDRESDLFYDSNYEFCIGNSQNILCCCRPTFYDPPETSLLKQRATQSIAYSSVTTSSGHRRRSVGGPLLSSFFFASSLLLFPQHRSEKSVPPRFRHNNECSSGDRVFLFAHSAWRIPKFKAIPYSSLPKVLMPYHHECFLVVGGDQSGRNVAAATYPGNYFEDCYHLQHCRHRWLKATFAQDLFQTLHGRLPLEVCENIAKYSARDRAIQAFQQHWSQDRPLQPGNISVPVHHGVTLWAHARGGDEEIVLNWNTEKLPNIFICHNGLGVNNLIVTEDDSSPNVEQVKGFDGIKLRGLGIVKSPDSFVDFNYGSGPCEIRWAIPPAPVKHSPKIPLAEDMAFQFVRAFDWNKPRTAGYSFLVWGSVILTINSHEAGTSAAPDEEFNGCHPHHATRLYLAMSPAEYVSELWVRTYHERLSTLIVVTNHGHSLVVGTQADRPGAAYHVVAELPQNKPCRMFYGDPYDERVSWLHFDSVSAWEHPAKRQVHSNCPSAPRIRHPPQSRLWYHTSARLDGVREVTPCIFARDSYEVAKISGLLLTYADGSRSSVGQVRLTMGTPKKVISDTMYLQYEDDVRETLETNGRLVDSGFDWFGFSEPLSSASSTKESNNTDSESHEVKDSPQFENTPSEGDGVCESVTYTNTIAVPMSGRLDWNKEVDDDVYVVSYHKGSTSKNDEMRHVLAEHAKMVKEEPVVKPLSILVGKIDPDDLKQVYQYAESNGNYEMYGL
ncbi:hypothetical protein FMUND_4292 [Fusarium mundagurra]|uniref:Uncharacterized protein n=1 Tax=Fusarium mundagurra TaxID=1567541 RepID=A0A8H5YWT6_9HYPO|nr:hypothetical protein FMUND_4292 [Fusarium mundagurra]